MYFWVFFVGFFYGQPCYKDCSVYLCQECDYSGFYASMLHHIKKSHDLKAGQYLAKHGKHVFKDKVKHICKICAKAFLYISNNLSGHVKTHGITAEQYAEHYLGAGGGVVRYQV